MKTNILYIFHVSAIGGGSLSLLNLVKELDKEKFHPIVLLKNRGPLCDYLEKFGATVLIEPFLNVVPYNTSLFNLNSVKQILDIIISLRKIRHWIKLTNSNIIHLNTMMMYPYSIPAKKEKRKVIVHIREHWPVNEHRFQLKFARRIINKYSDLIIAINHTSSKIINLPKKTHIIFDWIDFNNRDNFIDFKLIFGLEYKKLKIFLFLGGVQKIKGSLEVVETFNKSITDKNARLLLVGCESKNIFYKGTKGLIKKMLLLFNYMSYSDKIKTIAKSDSRIIFIPSTNHVKSLFEQSFCTIAYPTVPHAILPIAESISLGKPILSAKTPEALEYSNYGKGAKLFKMNDKDEFKKELIYMLNNQEIINKNAMENASQINNLFSKEKNSFKLNQLYKSL